MRRPHFGPISIPEAVWDDLFEEIEPVYRERDGKKLRRFRLIGTDLIGTQDPMDELFECKQISIEPMPRPLGLLLTMGWEPPKIEA